MDSVLHLLGILGKVVLLVAAVEIVWQLLRSVAELIFLGRIPTPEERALARRTTDITRSVKELAEQAREIDEPAKGQWLGLGLTISEMAISKRETNRHTKEKGLRPLKEKGPERGALSVSARILLREYI